MTPEYHINVAIMHAEEIAKLLKMPGYAPRALAEFYADAIKAQIRNVAKAENGEVTPA